MEHLEGRQSVYAALMARQRKFQVLLLKQGMHEDKIAQILEVATAQNIPMKYVDGKELDGITHGSTHGGVVAICSPKPRMDARQLLMFAREISGKPLMLLLEGVDDARNLGFTLRSADAMGVHCVLIKKHLWDFDPVEVSRPSSGAFERLAIAQIDDVEPIKELQKMGMQLIGCIAGVKRKIYDIDMKKPTILAIGGEKRGLSGAVRSICDRLAMIPTVGPDASSLSLSHASGIVMAEAMRQRHFGMAVQEEILVDESGVDTVS